jgi:hypothetical protein
MKTIEIEVAMMRELDVRQNVIVPNVSWGMRVGKERALHECDLLKLTRAGYATEIEIKVSKSDLLRDCKKAHGHDHPAIKYLYFAVPYGMKAYALEHIPERAGLYVITYSGSAYQVKEAKATDSIQWTDKERLKLSHLGCMRILGLKKKLLKKANG